METIRIAADFHPDPGGRYYSDGEYSGQRFREEILRPKLDVGGEVLVDIGGAEGYGSSFLEEAFGGLVRERYFEAEDLHNRLKVVCDDPEFVTFVNEIWEYIDEADAELRGCRDLGI